jgi:hypothetical protein
MKIRDKAGGPRGLKLAEMEEKVWFDAYGIAECPKAVGEMLCARFDSIVPVRGAKKAKARGDKDLQ